MAVDIIFFLESLCSSYMKLLEFHRDEAKDRVTVTCAGREVSVYSHCAYCRYCAGVRVGKRTMATPQRQALSGVRHGSNPDENLLNAAMMFNSLVRDGTGIECEDEAGEGFASMYYR
jgi:hypothetical protein